MDGRKIVPVFKSYCPIGNTQALTLCTSFTEDDKVFAVLGVFIDFTGDAQLCLSRDHQTIHIGHELLQQWISQAPPGLLLTPDITAERRTTVLMNLLKAQGDPDGHEGRHPGRSGSAASVATVVKPALERHGHRPGLVRHLDYPGVGDTSTSLTQLQSYIGKWKGEGVNAIILAGQFVSGEAIRGEDQGRHAHTCSADRRRVACAGGGQDETAAGVKPNPYDGMLTANGLTDSETWKPPDSSTVSRL